jgi:hypothetical protein
MNRKIDQRLNLSPIARLLLLGNALLVAPALWATVGVLNHMEYRWTLLTPYRAPLLRVLLGVILISIVMTWRGSRRAANWMLVLFSIYVGVCIWESAIFFGRVERAGIDLSELTVAGE